MKPESLSQIARASAVAVVASVAVVAVSGLVYVTSGLVRAVLNHIDPLARDAVVEADPNLFPAVHKEFVYIGLARQSEEFKQWRTARFFRQADAASGTNSCYDLLEPELWPPSYEHLDTGEILDRIDRGELSELSSPYYELSPSARDAAVEADNGVPSYRSVAQAHYLNRAMELETWRQVTYADHFREAAVLSGVNSCYVPMQDSPSAFFSVMEDRRTVKLLDDLSDSLDRRQPSYCEGFDDTSKILDDLDNWFLSNRGYEIYDSLHGLRPSSGERYSPLDVVDGHYDTEPISDL